MADNWTYDPTTPLGQVRLLLPDRSAPPGPFLFYDRELQAFLTLEGQDVRRATALACEQVAGNELLILKVLQLGTQKTDGAAVAAAWRARATQLRADADIADAATGASFDWAEVVLDPSTARQRVWEQAERSGA